MRDDHLLPDFLDRHAPARRERMLRRGQQDDVVAAEGEGLDAAIRRLEGQDAEVDAAVEHGAGDLARWHAADFHRDLGVQRRELLDVRQQRVHGGFVGPDDDPSAPHLLQLLHRGLGLAGEAEQALRVILEQAPRLGQRAVPGRPVEQALAQLVLDPSDRLADGGLGPVEPPGGGRKAPIRGNGQKRREIRQLHK